MLLNLITGISRRQQPLVRKSPKPAKPQWEHECLSIELVLSQLQNQNQMDYREVQGFIVNQT